MNCDDFQEHASRFIDGMLNASDQAALFEHLSDCSGCRSFLSSSVRVREVIEHDHVDVPTELDEKIFERLSGRPNLFPAAQDRKRSLWRREVVLSFPLAAAALLLVILASVLISLVSVRTGSAGINGLETVLGKKPVAGRQTVVVVYQLPEEQVVSLPPAKIFEVGARTVAN